MILMRIGVQSAWMEGSLFVVTSVPRFSMSTAIYHTLKPYLSKLL